MEGGDSLAFLEETDKENCGLANEKKINLKIIIEEIKKEDIKNEIEINITEDSDEEAIHKFL